MIYRILMCYDNGNAGYADPGGTFQDQRKPGLVEVHILPFESNDADEPISPHGPNQTCSCHLKKELKDDYFMVNHELITQ